jgi:ligand-binding sensor domain-containing protein
VYNLHCDKKGYLWLFTNYGVLKYNSSRFTQVLRNLPFSESFIYSSYEARDGRMWVANSNGRIFEIRNDSAFVIKEIDPVSENLRKNIMEIYKLYVDDSLNIYAITKHYSYKFIKSRGYEAINLSNQIKPDSLTFRILDKGDQYLTIYNYKGNDTVFCGGLNSVNIHIENLKRDISLECGKTIVRHAKRFDDNIYFTQFDKLVKVTEDTVKVIPIGALITNYTRDRNNHLWVGCYNDGLYELDENDSIVNHLLEKTTVNDVLVDFQNSLWVSTSGSGLYHCKKLNDKYFDETSPFSKPISFVKQFGDTLFIGTSSNGVYMSVQGEILPFATSAADGEPLDMVQHGSELIISSRYKTESYSFSGASLINNSVPYNKFTAIQMESLSADSLMCLTRKSVYYVVNNKVTRSIALNNKANAFKRINGKVLLGMDNGVWELKNDKLFRPEYLEPTKDYLIRSIVTDPSGGQWFCTIGGGIFKLNPNNVPEHYNTLSGLPSDIVNDLCFAGKEQMLLSTNKGLYLSKTKTNGRYDWVKVLNENTQHAIFYDNKIYATTRNGLVIIDHLKSRETQAVHFNLSSVNINNKPVPETELANLRYNQNNIEFEFDQISYNAVRFDLGYKLVGPVLDSGEIEANVVKFQKLPPGEYSLRISKLKEGQEEMMTISFKIIPAFWQNNWFIVLFYLFIFFITSVIIAVLVKYLKRKADKRAEANRLVLEYRLIALKAQINPHFMSNCLSAIQHLIINKKLEEAIAYIAKFGLLVRQILNFSTQSLVTLEDELAIASLNMELEQLRFEIKFHFEIRIHEGINAKKILVPSLLLNPIIENAIWHGLLPNKAGKRGELFIDIKANSHLEISIEDNGVGRKRANLQLGNTKESKGLKLTEQRLTNMNYLFKTDTSGIIYTDLYKEGKPSGTKVTITLPLNLKASGE